MKKYLVILLCLTFLIMGCGKDANNETASNEATVESSTTVENDKGAKTKDTNVEKNKTVLSTYDKYSQYVRNQTLKERPDSTFGDCCDAFFTDTKWTTYLDEDNKRVVELSGKGRLDSILPNNKVVQGKIYDFKAHFLFSADESKFEADGMTINDVPIITLEENAIWEGIVKKYISDHPVKNPKKMD